MKTDIRQPRTASELYKYDNDLNYFMAHFSLLGNRDKNTQIKILQKLFKGDTSLSDLMRFVDDKENFIGGVEFTKNDIIKLSEIEDLDIIYDQDDTMIVKVESADAIKAIGCNSLWCFTYGAEYDKAHQTWYNYSYNNIVYVIIDFREKNNSPDFMYVLISPLIDEDTDELIEYEEDDDNSPLFNMSNENYSDPYFILEHIFGEDYENIIRDYLYF